MARKLPPEEAFRFYVDLGHKRSYRTVAQHYYCDKRTVTACAQKHQWQERVAKIDRESRALVTNKLVEGRAAVDERHLRVVRAIQARALQTLQAMPITTALGAVRALDIAIKAERAVLGRTKESHEPTLSDILAASYGVAYNPHGAVAREQGGAPMDDEADAED